jgi:NTP pyrophosphatase (non-canonical NTP hydrolase)
MSKPANQSNKWQFTVVQAQLPSPFGGNVPYWGNFRTDTNECIGVTTEQYGILQNSDLIDAARAALAERGLTGYTEKIISAGNGSRFYASFSFRDKQIANAVGDVFGYVLTLKNSFDRSLRAALDLGFERLTCKNGASSLEKDIGVTKKHSPKISVEFLGEAIDRALASGERTLRVYDEMAGVGISDEQGVNILGNLTLKDVLSGKIEEEAKTIWLNPRRDEDKARNLWTLYNAVTEYLTHKVAEERFEYSGKVSAGLLMRLVNASRRADVLAALTAAVPVPVVAVSTDE